MRGLVGFSMLMLTLTGSRVGATTITFERDVANAGAVTYSSTNAAVTVTNWGIGGLFVSDGIAPGPVHYNVDGPVASSFDPAGAGTMEFFIDGCVPVFAPFLVRYNCTPTVASYLQIIGSIPELGIPLQSLMIGTFPGGSAAGFSPPNLPSHNVSGAGTSTLPLSLSQALGLDPATEWQFSVALRFGFQPPPLRDDQVINTDGSGPQAVPEPMTLGLLGTGVAALAMYRRRVR
jgi:hypothetical protein